MITTTTTTNDDDDYMFHISSATHTNSPTNTAITTSTTPNPNQRHGQHTSQHGSGGHHRPHRGRIDAQRGDLFVADADADGPPTPQATTPQTAARVCRTARYS